MGIFSKKIIASLFIVFAFSFGSEGLFAQSTNKENSNLRERTVLVAKDSFLLDSLYFFPSSVSLKNTVGADNTFYTRDRFFIWTQKPSLDSVVVEYRIMPSIFNEPARKLDTTIIGIRNMDNELIGGDYDPFKKESIFDVQGLDYSGSFTRGITVGNNQDLVLNSAFNLQMAGDIGDDIQILAAISDNNIPIQAEGNTQQLQEFDKLFIQLTRKKTSLLAGDYEITSPKGYFLKYYKKLQGATLSNEFDIGKNGTLKSKGSLAIARGKFARNNLAVIEGNQGPYKLIGSDGERFIIVLAGTESVYIDGILMERGWDFDYVIDYNRGEISFTNKQLITKDKRVVVEFEYSDQNYLRSLYGLNLAYTDKKGELYFNMLSEQDALGSTNQLSLTDQDRMLMSQLGDQIDTFTNSISLLEGGFDQDRIMYDLIDTLVNGQIYQNVLVYSTNTETGLFVARFTEVGAGNGNYIRAESAANGQVFQWVTPDSSTGILQGTFEPVVKVVPPKLKRVFSLGGSYAVGKRGKVNAEIALTNNDINRFASLGDDDNLALGANVGYAHIYDLSQKKDTGWQIEIGGNYEFTQEKFDGFSPFRSREFNRNWSIVEAASDIHIVKAKLGLKHKKEGFLFYDISSLFLPGSYEGIMHSLDGKWNKKGFEFITNTSLLNADQSEESAWFFRPRLEVSQSFKKLGNTKMGVYYERDENRITIDEFERIKGTSLRYDVLNFFIQKPVTERLGIGMKYGNRVDFHPDSLGFVRATNADDINFNGSFTAKGQALNWNLNYRNLVVENSEVTSVEPQETYLGNIRYNGVLKKGLVRISTSYEISSGQEPKLEFNYLAVNPGEGQYQWVDRNQDSIKQVNEFEIAIFQDKADHIRVSALTNEYVRVNAVRLSQSLQINPKAIWFSQTGIKKAISKFSSNTSLQIDRRVKIGEGISPFNPFEFNVIDSSLVAIRSTIQQSIFFDRTNPKFNADAGFSENRNRAVLTTGYESRLVNDLYFKMRYNISKVFGLQLTAGKGRRLNDSEFFVEKDYDLEKVRIEPQLRIQPNSNFRTLLTYSYRNTKNVYTLGEQEEAAFQEIKVEVNYNKLTKSSLRFTGSYVRIDFTGTDNNALEFVILDGLQSGQNFLWNLSFDRRLSEVIQLGISYEGRRTGGLPIVHTGRMQLRATF